MYSILTLFLFFVFVFRSNCTHIGRFHLFKVLLDHTTETQIYRYFLSQNHILHEIIGNNITNSLSLLGYHIIPTLNDTILSNPKYHIKQSISIISNTSLSLLNQTIDTISSIQGNLVESWINLRDQGFSRNPSALKIRDLYIVISAYPGYTNHNEDIVAYWTNITYNSSTMTYKQSETTFRSNCMRENNPSFYFVGYNNIQPEDARILSVDPNRIHVSYTVHFPQRVYYVKVGISDLLLNNISNCYEIQNTHILHLDNSTNDEYHDKKYDQSKNQKNWVSFIYDSKIYYIVHIHPLSIYKVSPNMSKHNLHWNLIPFSIENTTNYILSHYWINHSIRGGTNAVPIGMNKYLGFFHTSQRFSDTSYTNYFMGAYTFTTHNLPFQLSEISPFPIICKEWYSGQTDHNYNLEYVVFPMSLAVDMKDSSIEVVVGRNNKHGLIIRMKLDKLLSSLIRLYPRNVSIL